MCRIFISTVHVCACIGDTYVELDSSVRTSKVPESLTDQPRIRKMCDNMKIRKDSITITFWNNFLHLFPFSKNEELHTLF